MISGEASAYATLGLRPGASRAEVDEAYRRLIKRYHPDRTGGDGNRAAEINRAYTLIRGDLPGSMRPRRAVAVPVPLRPRPSSRRRAGWMFVSVLLVAGVFGVANDVPRRASVPALDDSAFQWPAPADPGVFRRSSALVDFEEPLQAAVIDRAVADAVKFHAGGDVDATVEYSRACHNSLRDEPSLTWFDSCAAFDEATVILVGANPFESGPFNGSSVMARQMGAARLLSHDMLAADSRLHQIRSRVELALVPRLDEAAAMRP